MRNDVQYVLSIAKTLTKPDTPLIGNFTLFVENFAQINLDGNHRGTTQVTITPAVRFNLGKPKWNNIGMDNWLLFGVEIPVAGPRGRMRSTGSRTSRTFEKALSIRCKPSEPVALEDGSGSGRLEEVKESAAGWVFLARLEQDE